MDLRHLRYFIAVAEESHFGRAAERLHIVQPALSMQIRALEEEVGGALFTRTSRRVQLTEAGATLLAEARRTILQAERAMTVVQRSLRGEIGSVNVGFAGNAALTGKLMDDLRTFHRRYPDAEIELCEVAPHLQEEAILDGRLDVGYCPSLNFEFDSRLITGATGRWPMFIALASDHRLASRRTLTIKSLSSEPFILYAADEDVEGPLASLRQLIGNEARVVHRVSNTLTVLAMVAAGLGLALVPEPITKVTIPNISYRPIAGAGVSAELLVVSRANESSGAVLAFLGVARDRTTARAH